MLESFNCFIDVGCSSSHMYEKYDLYTLLVPEMNQWLAFVDIILDLEIFCQAGRPVFAL